MNDVRETTAYLDQSKYMTDLDEYIYGNKRYRFLMGNVYNFAFGLILMLACGSSYKFEPNNLINFNLFPYSNQYSTQSIFNGK